MTQADAVRRFATHLAAIGLAQSAEALQRLAAEIDAEARAAA
jgi:hypothetical protein